MAQYNGLNYMTDGGNTLHIGGKLEVAEGANFDVTLSAATTEAAGVVKQGAAVADAAGSAPTAAEFKALLDSLRTAGIIATST